MTQEAKSAIVKKWWSKLVEGPGRKIRRDITLKGGDADSSDEAD